MIDKTLLEGSDSQEPFEISSEWREEIARRCREIDDDATELIPGEDVLGEATAGLQG
jgi:hypothetical protein